MPQLATLSNVDLYLRHHMASLDYNMLIPPTRYMHIAYITHVSTKCNKHCTWPCHGDRGDKMTCNPFVLNGFPKQCNCVCIFSFWFPWPLLQGDFKTYRCFEKVWFKDFIVHIFNYSSFICVSEARRGEKLALEQHYNDVTMSSMAFQLNNPTIVFPNVYSGTDQRKLRVTGLCEGNSPHKGPVTRKMFPLDDVIM